MNNVMSKPFVAILMGSDSDLPVMEASFEILKKFDIPFEVKVTSAHRTPEATHTFVTDADARGCVAFICAAGMAAHLAGAVSATTLKPVIGVPINGSLDDSTWRFSERAAHVQYVWPYVAGPCGSWGDVFTIFRAWDFDLPGSRSLGLYHAVDPHCSGSVDLGGNSAGISNDHCGFGVCGCVDRALANI